MHAVRFSRLCFCFNPGGRGDAANQTFSLPHISSLFSLSATPAMAAGIYSVTSTANSPSPSNPYWHRRWRTSTKATVQVPECCVEWLDQTASNDCICPKLTAKNRKCTASWAFPSNLLLSTAKMDIIIKRRTLHGPKDCGMEGSRMRGRSGWVMFGGGGGTGQPPASVGTTFSSAGLVWILTSANTSRGIQQHRAASAARYDGRPQKWTGDDGDVEGGVEEKEEGV